MNGELRAFHLLRHGDVIDDAWVTQFEGLGPADSFVGPAWSALWTGVLSLKRADATRFHAVLRAGPCHERRGALQWLRVIIASDLAPRLASLSLHLWLRGAETSWSGLLADVRLAAKDVSFELMLAAPVSIPGASLLPRVRGAGCEPFGDGSLVRGDGRCRLGGAPEPLRGWASVVEGDWVDRRWRPFRVAQRAAAQRDDDAAPWVIVPAEGWRHAPLVREGAHWLLRVEARVLRFRRVRDALWLLADDERATPVDWFTPVASRGAFLVPGKSEFFLGGAQGSTEDPASPGLRALREASADAALWFSRLMAPWGAPSTLTGGVRHGDVELDRGAVVRLSVTPWRDFERDLPILLAHPLLRDLARLELFGPRASSFAAVARAHRPSLVVLCARGRRSSLRLVT